MATLTPYPLWNQMLPLVQGPWRMGCGFCSDFHPDRSDAAETSVPHQLHTHLTTVHGVQQATLDRLEQFAILDRLIWHRPGDSQPYIICSQPDAEPNNPLLR